MSLTNVSRTSALGLITSSNDPRQILANSQLGVDALEQRAPPDLGKITARIDALDGRVTDQAQLANRLDTLSGRIEFSVRP